MPSSRHHWLGVAQDCARSLAIEQEPISFLLGAGASLSSGAPTTETVQRALAGATVGRLDPADLRHRVDRIGERDKQNILRDLFTGIRPYIGYLSLAALGRHRRVVAANLNWDPLISMACADLGVPCQSFDLAERDRWSAVDDLPAGTGVSIIHIHGRLGSRSRIGRIETLAFTSQEEEFLAETVWANPTVIAGASLVSDSDLEPMFQRLGMTADLSSARWLFARHDDRAPLPTASMASEHLARWALNCVTSDAVDFDELMLTILAEQVGFSYELLRQLRPTANLPARENLIYPSPELIRDCLNSRIVILSGEPKLGKTTLVYLMAWWRILWNHPRGADVDAALAALGGYEDTATTVAALATQGDDPTAGAATAGKSVLVLDDPYGQDSKASNPLFLPELRRVAGLPDSPVVLVATREPGWQAALRTKDSSESDLAAIGIASVSPDVSRWWTKDALLQMAASLPHSQELSDAVSGGFLTTPGLLLERSWLNSVRGAASSARAYAAEIVTSKEELITLVPALAHGSSLARFQELCHEPLTEREFEEILGAPVESVPGLRQMLIRYSFEGKPRLRLAHPTYREAIDSYLSDPSNMSAIVAWLESRPLASHLTDAIRAYRFVDLVITEPDRWVDSPLPQDAAEWGAQILAAAQNETTVTALRQFRWDLWTATELAYELVRLYPDIKYKGGREFIRELLANEDASGAYAILEACLYLRSSASDEVWTALKARLYDLTAPDPDNKAQRAGEVSCRERQLALAIDGLLWRPPPSDTFTEQFISAAFEQTNADDPLWAVLRFAAGYHPGGLAALGVEDLVEKDQDVVLTAAQVEFITWLISWHFVHQSRARAILARQPYVDKDFLCRSLHAAPVDQGMHGLRRLMMSLMMTPSAAGWVMHLGCNLLSIGVAVDDGCRNLMRQSMALVPDNHLGVITSALTYASSAQFADVLRPYFARPANRDALLDAAWEGPLVNGFRIRPPRFVCSRGPRELQTELGLRWPRLHEAGVSSSDPEQLARQLRERAELLVSRGELDGKAADQLLARVLRGDLRLLEQTASARHAPDNLMDHLLQVATFALQEQEGLF